MTGKFPPLKPRDVVKILVKAGFVLHHQRGSHAYYHKEGIGYVCVPMHAKEIKKGTLHSIIKQSGMSKDEFYSLS